MPFVHGHPRALGWVKAHWRRPNRAERAQLPLIAAVPTGERDEPPRADPAHGEQAPDETEAGGTDAGEPVPVREGAQIRSVR